MSKVAPELAEAMLDAVKSNMDDSFVFIFAGAVPSGPEVALNMGTTHTQIAKLSVDGDDTTGVTFEVAADYVLSKTAAEDWVGLVAFDGFVAGPGTLTPTFFRVCKDGDDGRGAASDMRLQGTVGGPASSADMKLGGGDTLTDNGTNTTSASVFNVRVSTIG